MIYHQSVFERWPLADESVQAIITSPPYWGLRKYDIPDIIIGGDANCRHQWEDILTPARGGKNTAANPSMIGNNRAIQEDVSLFPRFGSKSNHCLLCGAWRGQYGLEPSYKDYVAHTVLWAKEAWRVLRDDGIFFLNLGDSYSSYKDCKQVAQSCAKGTPSGNAHILDKGDSPTRDPKRLKVDRLPDKSKVLIPYRVAIALIDEGWTLRNDIVWCLSGGTWVYVKTQKGEMPMRIKEMARLKPDTVKLWNGEKWTQVLGWSKSKRKNTELELLLRSGERISCTPNHKFPTERGLLEAKDIITGDALLSVKLPSPNEPLTPALVPDDIAWFIGLYIAEGSMSGECIQIAGHIKEVDRYHTLINVVAKYGGSIQKYNLGGKSQTINIHSKILNAIISEYVSGKTAKNKGLAVKCWRRNNDFLEQLLTGYLHGDGHWDANNRRWRLGFARNYNLERDLRSLCARLEHKLILNLGTAVMGDKKFPCFRGEIRFSTTTHHNSKNPNEVMEIRKARCREIYDIGVEDEPHLFALGSGVLTHNSKPNGMPESCKDRFTKKHESIFMFTKSPKYYFDLGAVSIPSKTYEYDKRCSAFERGRNEGYDLKINSMVMEGRPKIVKNRTVYQGKSEKTSTFLASRPMCNPGDVWSIPTQPSPIAHFAMWPKKLVERMVKCSTRKGDTVLDPFCGSGTTLLVAEELGRKGAGIDLGYEKIQTRRLSKVQKEIF